MEEGGGRARRQDPPFFPFLEPLFLLEDTVNPSKRKSKFNNA